jgi:hypothetical protein
MRVEFKGKGEPIPEIALPAIGSDILPQTMLLSAGNFLKAIYEDVGYTNYEVWCIGAAGGRGFRASTNPAAANPRYTGVGGAGGGGGMHNVRGILADLPAAAPVVVGTAGLDATAGGDGTDGGYSSFNGVTCRASGGKGGRVGATFVGSPESAVVPTWLGAGGEGGSGGRTLAGGGAAGGTPGVEGGLGTWDLEVGLGTGGGGGQGGRRTAVNDDRFSPPTTYTLVAATHGGNGSFSYDDLTVYGQRGITQSEALTYPPSTWISTPGDGGGAKLPNGQTYGSKAVGSFPDGAVFIRLTAI